ncbi:MAG: GYD domain-containing protein [Candidatus Dormibacteria bacterium]
MADYVVLCKFTAEGAKNITQSTARLHAHMEQAQPQGIKVVAEYLLFGHYDWIFLLEAPDDETIALAVLKLVAAGIITSETVRAFDPNQSQQLLDRLG